jgi:hypothetical protein
MEHPLLQSSITEFKGRLLLNGHFTNIFMKKHFLFLILLAIIHVKYTKNYIPKPNWQLKTEDTHVTIAIINNYWTLVSASTPSG